jgi:hypothetical protein
MIEYFISLALNWNAKKRIQEAGKVFSTEILDQGHQSFEALGIEQFESVYGLPGYPPANFWQRISGSSKPVELLLTQANLIFCDPSASASLRRTIIPLINVISVRTDYLDGSILIIKSICGTIRCDTQVTTGANAIKNILNDMLRDQKAKI